MKEYDNIGDFDLIRDLFSGEFGIVLKGEKRTTLRNRVLSRLEALRLSNIREYVDLISADPQQEELYLLASDITNKETYFFREREQLAVFSSLLKDIKASKRTAGANTLKLLSLASATGEEAYTLSMLAHMSGLFVGDWEVNIIGIDVDKDAIRKAEEAAYTVNSFRAHDSDAGMVRKYFVREGGRFVLTDYIRKGVEFRHGNLLSGKTFDGLAGVDVIFCRNVLIYMSKDAVSKIAENIFHSLSDAGYLFVGGSEGLIRKTDLFCAENIDGVTVYRKNLGKKTG